MTRLLKVCSLVLLIFIITGTTTTAKTVNLKPTWKNILWLAKTMEAENGNAKDDSTVTLTGIVVCQRVRAKSYPNSVKGVISQSGQYSTWRNGKIAKIQPSERCLEIAEEILRFKLWKDYPHNLVFQSQFTQGRKLYKYIRKDNEYFCLA